MWRPVAGEEGPERLDTMPHKGKGAPYGPGPGNGPSPYGAGPPSGGPPGASQGFGSRLYNSPRGVVNGSGPGMPGTGGPPSRGGFQRRPPGGGGGYGRGGPYGPYTAGPYTPGPSALYGDGAFGGERGQFGPPHQQHQQPFNPHFPSRYSQDLRQSKISIGPRGDPSINSGAQGAGRKAESDGKIDDEHLGSTIQAGNGGGGMLGAYNPDRGRGETDAADSQPSQQYQQQQGQGTQTLQQLQQHLAQLAGSASPTPLKWGDADSSSGSPAGPRRRSQELDGGQLGAPPVYQLGQAADVAAKAQVSSRAGSPEVMSGDAESDDVEGPSHERTAQNGTTAEQVFQVFNMTAV